MKKTVVITSNAYFPNIGGVENSLKYLAKSYSALNYNVIVVVSDISPTKESLLASEIQDDVLILRYPTYGHYVGLKKLFRPILSAMSALKLLKSLTRTQDVTLTISRFHTSTVLAKLANCPNITYLVPGVVKNQNASNNLIDCSGLTKLKSYLSRQLHHVIQKVALNVSDNIFVFSQNMRKQVFEIFPSELNTPIVKPGVDTVRFCPKENTNEIKAKYGIPLNKTILLTVGRFVKAKGFEFVVDSLKDLPNCHLVMVGDGDGLDNIKKQIELSHLQESITLIGSKQNTVPFYQLADIFVMSSTYEPLGQTILEAIACSLPVIAFKGPSITTATEEILTDEEAMYTSKINSDGLVEAINKLTHDHTLMKALSLRGRKTAIEKFSWDTLALQMLNAKNGAKVSKNDF